MKQHETGSAGAAAAQAEAPGGREIQLSPGEWKLMERLWAESPQTITRLTAALQPVAGWGKHTIITMLNRLEAKGAVRHDEGGPAKQFYPRIPRAEAALQETEQLLQKVYGGSLGLLVNAFVAQKGITEAERAELLRILEQADGADGSDAEQV